MIENVYIRTRPGADSTITDSLLVAVGDAIRAAGRYVIQDKDEIDQRTLILALGGDGTMLSAIHLAAEHGAYVTGFNYGHLGYLVPSSVTTTHELTSTIKTLFYDMDNDDGHKMSYNVNTYKLPLLTWNRTLRRGCYQAVNDFYFVPAANGSAADFTVRFDNADSYFETKSSGIVVATPFGSTGLALSAGGSVLAPNSDVIEVVPMLPHTLTSRPIIVPNNTKIIVSFKRKVKVFADGRHIDDFGEGEVELKVKKRTINFIQPASWNFFDNLKNKMKWQT